MTTSLVSTPVLHTATVVADIMTQPEAALAAHTATAPQATNCEEATWEANCSNAAAHKVTWKDDAGVGEMLMCDLHTEEFKERSEQPHTDIAWTMIEILADTEV